MGELGQGRPTLCTPELTQKICSFIRAGAFAHVAAQAVGISNITFMEWMRRGEGTDANRDKNSLYADFAEQVNTARAQARMAQEIKITKKNPEFWLRNGPGKSKADNEGWTEINKTEITHEGPVHIIQRNPGESIADYLRQIEQASNGGDTNPD